MAQIVRATKAGSTSGDYVTGTTIKSSEVNADFNGIVSVVNSQLANDNIATGAAIAYAKLALGNSIVNADIATSAAIVGTKLANNTITNSQIAVNGAIYQLISSSIAFSNYNTTSETLVSTITNFTSRGGVVMFLPVPIIGFILYTSAGSQTLTVRIKRAGTTVLEYNYPISGTLSTSVPINGSAWSHVPGASTATYTMHIQVSSVTGITAGGIQPISNVTSLAQWTALELS